MSQVIIVAMPSIQSLFVSDLIRHLRQHLNLSQEKFAAKLGISFKTVNRSEKGHSLTSPIALKLVEDLLKSVEEFGQVLFRQYFPEGELNV